MANVEFYRCSVCGNMVVKLINGGGELVCCGEPMKLLNANSTDAAQEKHVPVVTKENGKITVAVGSVAHPMIPEHYIQWIAIVSESKLYVEHLKPGAEPKATFEDIGSGTAYEYCNLHGLWKAEF